MNFLKNVIDQLQHAWHQSSNSTRAVFAVTAGLCVALVAGVGIWSARPQYVALATDLSPAEAAETVSKLDSAGIDNKLNFSGSAVLVPKNQWNKARLLVGDQLGPVTSEAQAMDDSLFGDPSLNHYKLLRRREEALGRTIARMNSVANAAVHIGRPEPSPFVREQKPTTASVVLELRSGAMFTKEQAAAVVAMVAGSVDGLDPDAVTVMDTNGRVLSSNASVADSDVASQWEYRRRLEADLASKAELMLAEMLGEGHAIVRVTANIDFTRTERTETTFDPDIKVKKSERVKTSSRTGSGSGGAGPAGTTSNVENFGGLAQNAPISEKEEENETEYETGKSVDTIKEAAGQIRRLTVAAMVDLTPVSDDPVASGSSVTKEQVEAIVRSAVGFDEQRQDEIEVFVTPLAGAATTGGNEMLEIQKWEFYGDLARNSSLGVAAIVALILGLLTLRKMRPITLPGDSSGLTPERMRVLAELSSHARQHPDVLSQVVASWLQQQQQAPADNPPAETTPIRKAAA